jgi:hypothetical protein
MTKHSPRKYNNLYNLGQGFANILHKKGIKENLYCGMFYGSRVGKANRCR